MNRKQMCVANLRYRRPTSDGAKQVDRLLGYLTYRESRDEGAKHVSGKERWTDHGMGRSVAEIAHRCADLRSDHVLQFMLVINPNPELMALVPLEQREAFVRELTEATVEDFFEARGIDTGCEYSYVMHHRGTDNPQAPGMHNPHTHVVLPGTVWTEESGERIPLYFSQNKKVNHIEMLHNVTEQHMTQMMDLYAGRDWEKRIDRIESIRELERETVNREPDAYNDLDDLAADTRIWVGPRLTDEHTSAFGYYQYFSDPNGDGSARLQFRPLLTGLAHDDADVLVLGAIERMAGDFSRLLAFQQAYLKASPAERAALLDSLHRQFPSSEMPEPPPAPYTPPEPTLDIDF